MTVTLSAWTPAAASPGKEYRADGGAWVEGTSIVVAAPADGSNDGAHPVEYRSTDTAGNVENAQVGQVKIVTTPGNDFCEPWPPAPQRRHTGLLEAGVPESPLLQIRIHGLLLGRGRQRHRPGPPADGSNDGEHVVEYRSTRRSSDIVEIAEERRP